MLAESRCGEKFLIAPGESLKKTLNVLGTEMFESKEKLLNRGGGGELKPFFMFYINMTIQAVQQ